MQTISTPATGAGKTFTAVSFIYRLIKHAGAQRVLFLVDRSNLGRQTVAEFQQYTTPDTGRKFTEIYNIQHLASTNIDPVARVTVSTIQRLYSVLRGEELTEDVDEISGFELASADSRPREVQYNPRFPIETFDFIVTDECHRSIYDLWRQALEYFDAFLIGLTATPSKQTIGILERLQNSSDLRGNYNRAIEMACAVVEIFVVSVSSSRLPSATPSKSLSNAMEGMRSNGRDSVLSLSHTPTASIMTK